MQAPLDLTIAIPVKNEARNLPGCIAAIGTDLAQQIVIIDSGSTDGTKSIAAANGIALIDFEWDGHFPKKRNWYLRHHTPTTKWVLFLDADEYLTQEFKTVLRAALTGDDSIDGYWLNYTIFFMGKNLKGGYPLKKLALFKVGKGEYERIDEDRWSKLDMEIHEHPIIDGKIGEIKSKIDHQDFRGIAHYITKHNEYAAWEAARYMKANADSAAKQNWTWKQQLKYRMMASVWIGPIYFIGSFILLGGFRDGKRGLAFSMLKMAYFNQIYIAIKEAQHQTSLP
ncbi:glycosyltransferase family 2 protein [Parasediminibacterium paludis]|uniref:Glycosyltransferase family 2 protein n=1 Tax=Parasediminibacterium paludis TaxID=908966 RepID=A0ABV8Q1K1_9BACT